MRPTTSQRARICPVSVTWASPPLSRQRPLQERQAAHRNEIGLPVPTPAITPPAHHQALHFSLRRMNLRNRTNDLPPTAVHRHRVPATLGTTTMPHGSAMGHPERLRERVVEHTIQHATGALLPGAIHPRVSRQVAVVPLEGARHTTWAGPVAGRVAPADRQTDARNAVDRNAPAPHPTGLGRLVGLTDRR